MSKPRGREHSTLTETATHVVRELQKIPGVKMIAPGEIKTAGRLKSGGRHVTVIYTIAGFELLITGQSVQRVAVHTISAPAPIVALLRTSKRLSAFSFSTRERKPGV